MNQPSINIYTDLIVPLGEKLRADERFADVKNIIYDDDTEQPYSAMPCIEYHVDAPIEDAARGSGSSTLQTRLLTCRIVFRLWIYDADSKQRMHEALFFLSGHLNDFVRDWTDLSPGVGLAPEQRIVYFTVTEGSAEGNVGYFSIVAEYVIYSGIGK